MEIPLRQLKPGDRFMSLGRTGTLVLVNESRAYVKLDTHHEKHFPTRKGKEVHITKTSESESWASGTEVTPIKVLEFNDLFGTRHAEAVSGFIAVEKGDDDEKVQVQDGQRESKRGGEGGGPMPEDRPTAQPAPDVLLRLPDPHGSQAMTPTQEQIAIVEAFHGGASIVVEAGAGAAKTTTCRMIGDALAPKRGTYIVFNKPMATEAAGKMPSTVACSTIHSLAFRAVGKHYAHRLQGARMRSDQIAQCLGIKPLSILEGKERRVLAAGYLAGFVMRALRRFCFSAESHPQLDHFQYVDGIDMPEATGRRTWRWNDEIRQAMLPALRRAWDDQMSRTGSLTYSHDSYLKTWALSKPSINGDFILVDEAQDFSPVMLGVLGHQVAQVALVGDSQQQIYEWRGSINALSAMPEAKRFWLSQSFRFGPPIADVANLLLGRLGTELRLSGRGGPSVVTPPADPLTNPLCILTRTNARAVGLLLQALADKVSVHLVGGGNEVLAFAKAAAQLQTGGFVSHPDLACFLDWGAVQEYVEHDPQGEELGMLVRLIDNYGADVVVAAIEQSCRDEHAAARVISTAHKSKGREWLSVQIADDFTKPPREGEEPRSLNEPELRLAYVACTRARQHLDVSAVPEFCEA